MWLYVSSFCNIKFLHYKYELSNPESEILTIISIKENGLTSLCVCVWCVCVCVCVCVCGCVCVCVVCVVYVCVCSVCVCARACVHTYLVKTVMECHSMI